MPYKLKLLYPPMKTQLHILLLEDNATDAELISRELRNSGFAFRLSRIETESELRHELDWRTPDLVLSDHGLPSFDGFRALEIVRETNPGMPFIFVSGSNDQGMVAKMYEQGATDYVFKADVRDLRGAVLRALENDSAPMPMPLAPRPAQNFTEVLLAPTRLEFCPECLQARDQFGVRVNLTDFFQSRAQVLVTRQPCPTCDNLDAA